MSDDLLSLSTAMAKATELPAGQQAWSPARCSALNDWAAGASTHPRPEDEALAAAWDEVIDAVDSFGTDACPSGDTGAITEGHARLNDAYRALTKRGLTIRAKAGRQTPDVR